MVVKCQNIPTALSCSVAQCKKYKNSLYPKYKKLFNTLRKMSIEMKQIIFSFNIFCLVNNYYLYCQKSIYHTASKHDRFPKDICLKLFISFITKISCRLLCLVIECKNYFVKGFLNAYVFSQSYYPTLTALFNPLSE